MKMDVPAEFKFNVPPKGRTYWKSPELESSKEVGNFHFSHRRHPCKSCNRSRSGLFHSEAECQRPSTGPDIWTRGRLREERWNPRWVAGRFHKNSRWRTLHLRHVEAGNRQEEDRLCFALARKKWASAAWTPWRVLTSAWKKQCTKSACGIRWRSGQNRRAFRQIH